MFILFIYGVSGLGYMEGKEETRERGFLDNGVVFKKYKFFGILVWGV